MKNHYPFYTLYCRVLFLASCNTFSPVPIVMDCRGGVHWWDSTSQLLLFSSFSSVLLPRLFLFSGVIRFSGEVLVSPSREVEQGSVGALCGFKGSRLGEEGLCDTTEGVTCSLRSRGRSLGHCTSVNHKTNKSLLTKTSEKGQNSK